jgi:four helix bundle protein
VLDAAEQFAVEVNRLIKSSAKPLTYSEQLKRAAGSIGANLAEGFGRGPGADRLNRYRIARGECEEALGWLRNSYKLREVCAKDFFPLSNRGIVISRMITGLIG